MSSNEINWTYIIVTSINVFVAVSGWIYASSTQDKRAQRQAKNAEINRLIDKIEDVFDELLKHIRVDWISQKSLDGSAQRRVAINAKLRFLMQRINKIDQTLPDVDHETLYKMRKLLTSDIKFSNRKKDQILAEVLSYSEIVLNRYQKKFN